MRQKSWQLDLERRSERERHRLLVFLVSRLVGVSVSLTNICFSNIQNISKVLSYSISRRTSVTHPSPPRDTVVCFLDPRIWYLMGRLQERKNKKTQWSVIILIIIIIIIIIIMIKIKAMIMAIIMVIMIICEHITLRLIAVYYRKIHYLRREIDDLFRSFG